MTQPGWYPRPDMHGTLGFWDGTAWTDQTQPAPQRKWDATKVAAYGFLALLVLAVALKLLY